MNPKFSTQSSIRADLEVLGVRSGDGLFVHASLSAIGKVIGGARAVVAALLDAVGETGLVGMPGYSADAYLPEFLQLDSLTLEDERRAEAAILGFDRVTSPTSGMGAIAETFRTWPETSRSLHPCASICLRGPDAQQSGVIHQLSVGQSSYLNL
jgi:aminoglycoside 3-N-acetyltransferase